MTTTPTSANSCTFTNGITVPTTGTTPGQTGWDGSVCVISGFNTTSSSSVQGYEQTLTLLLFSDGTNTVADGDTSKTLMLDLDTPGTTNLMFGYNLLIAQPNNLFPVAAGGEMYSQNASKQWQFPAISIPGPSPADSSSGINAFIFVQNLQAFPSSDMAQSFTTALNNALAGPPADIDSTMNAWFATTESFKDVYYSAYLAAQSYVTAFAFAWANFASSYTYYVYTTGEATGSTTTGGTVSLLGTITFTQNAQSGIPSLTDPTGGYTITYQPASGSSVQLTFADGQVLNADGGDEPAICLQATFMNKSNVTGNQSDYGTIVPSLAGTVYGQQAIATAYQQDLSSGTSGLQTFLNSAGWQLTMDIMNIAMGVKALGEIVGWVYGKASGWWNGSNQPDPPTTSDVDAQESANVEQTQDVLQGANPNADVPDAQELPAGQQQLQQEVITQNNETQLTELQDELNAEAAEVETDLEFENNTQIETEASDLMGEETTLEGINPSASDASQQISTLQQSNVQLQDQIAQENTALEASMSQTEATSLENASEAEDDEIEEEEEEQEQEEHEEEDEEDGDDGGLDEMDDV
ncbi:hypothetical protein ACMHYB_45670 [Sorangium sp. So ce1128]